VNALFTAGVGIQAFCATQGWKCCAIDGVAVQRWGEPRQTRDVDLTLFTGLGHEERFIDPILAHYAARRPDARQFALERRVLLVETASGIPLDISLGGLLGGRPAGVEGVRRPCAGLARYRGCHRRTCNP
jgi:hypothetical protein